MKNPIIIDKKRFNRVKKLLKKTLEKQNINISLSESGEIVSKSLGFTDNNHIEKTDFNDIVSLNNELPSYNTKKIYLEYIISVLKYIEEDLLKRKENIKKNPQAQEVGEFYYLFHNVMRLLSIIEENKECIINNNN